VRDRLRPRGGPEPDSPGKPTHKVNIEKPAPMNGASHTLFANTVDSRLKIEMASRREDMQSLLEYAQAEADEMERAGTNKRGLKKALRRVWEALGRAHSLHTSTFQGTKMTAAIENTINEHVTTAAGLLGDIGRDFQLKSLRNLGHASTWVTVDAELKNDYRGDYFRGRVYGGWDSQHRSGGAFRVGEFNRLRSLIPPGSPELADPATYLCPCCNNIRRDVERTDEELTLDHNPSVITHWQTAGHNLSHDERHDWYNGKGAAGATLLPMCRSCNSSKGGGNDEPNTYKVGLKFRGKHEGKAP
jgi:hypothetical protein